MSTGTVQRGGPGRALLLAEATRQARAGRYDEARATLAELGDTTRDTEVLDLQARMHAQQGRLTEADRCWEQALGVDPELSAARSGRDRIAVLRAGGGSRGRGRTAALAVGGVLVVAAAAAAGAWLAPRSVDGGPDAAALSRLQAEQQRTADEVAGLRAALGPAPELAELTGRLAGGPVVARPVPGGTALTFPDGLFSGGDTLTDDGRAALADLGRRLAPVAGRLPITVTGHAGGTADDADQRAEDVDLGLERAAAAARELAAATGRPLSDLRLTSSGSAAQPFPGDPARNRTVTVLVGGS